MYPYIRPLLFQTEPETLHRWAIAWAKHMGNNAFLHPLLSPFSALKDPRLTQTVWGLTFQHPVGLAAGFDKNAEAIAAWPRLGFAFSEVGTITAQGQQGNPRPRLFRLVADEAVINRYGFNNRGASVVADRLALAPPRPVGHPVGINLGKSKVTALEEAATDYQESFRKLYPFGDYFVVNVSSPNTPGLRSLQNKTSLLEILDRLQACNGDGKPLLVKIAPDLTWSQLDEVLEVVTESDLDGIIATNTTLGREGLRTQTVSTGNPPVNEAGGLSGPPVRDKSTEMIRYIYRETQGEIPIVGVGGIDSAEAAWEKIVAGASLVQVYTGLVFKGPGLARAIARGLSKKLDDAGMAHISEAIGSAVS